MNLTCTICGQWLPRELLTFPKLYNMTQEQKDEIMALQVHETCCKNLVMTERTIQTKLRLTSGQGNYELCEMLEQILMNSSLNNSELRLEIIETKIIEGEHEIKSESKS